MDPRHPANPTHPTHSTHPAHPTISTNPSNRTTNMNRIQRMSNLQLNRPTTYNTTHYTLENFIADVNKNIKCRNIELSLLAENRVSTIADSPEDNNAVQISTDQTRKSWNTLDSLILWYNEATLTNGYISVLLHLKRVALCELLKRKRFYVVYNIMSMSNLMSDILDRHFHDFSDLRTWRKTPINRMSYSGEEHGSLFHILVVYGNVSLMRVYLNERYYLLEYGGFDETVKSLNWCGQTCFEVLQRYPAGKLMARCITGHPDAENSKSLLIMNAREVCNKIYCICTLFPDLPLTDQIPLRQCILYYNLFSEYDCSRCSTDIIQYMMYRQYTSPTYNNMDAYKLYKSLRNLISSHRVNPRPRRNNSYNSYDSYRSNDSSTDGDSGSDNETSCTDGRGRLTSLQYYLFPPQVHDTTKQDVLLMALCTLDIKMIDFLLNLDLGATGLYLRFEHAYYLIETVLLNMDLFQQIWSYCSIDPSMESALYYALDAIQTLACKLLKLADDDLIHDLVNVQKLFDLILHYTDDCCEQKTIFYSETLAAMQRAGLPQNTTPANANCVALKVHNSMNCITGSCQIKLYCLQNCIVPIVRHLLIQLNLHKPALCESMCTMLIKNINLTTHLDYWSTNTPRIYLLKTSIQMYELISHNQVTRALWTPYPISMDLLQVCRANYFGYTDVTLDRFPGYIMDGNSKKITSHP